MGLTVFGSPGPLQTPNVQIWPDGGETFYVGTALPAGQAGEKIADRFFTTINQALSACVTARGDIVQVLPGYTESISSAGDSWSNLGTKTNVTIQGSGNGAQRPTITWAASTSTVLMDAAGFVINNMVLQLEPTTGTVNVAAPITVSAASCAITNCRINCGTDANNKVTIGVTTTAGATDFVFSQNKVRGAALATCTTFLRLVGVANPVVSYNDIVCGTTSAAVGPIQELTTACTGVYIGYNVVHNNAASSTGCISMPLASTTGTIEFNRCRNMTDSSNAQIVVTSGDVQLFENRGVNNSNENGISLGTNSV